MMKWFSWSQMISDNYIQLARFSDKQKVNPERISTFSLFSFLESIKILNVKNSYFDHENFQLLSVSENRNEKCH